MYGTAKLLVGWVQDQDHPARQELRVLVTGGPRRFDDRFGTPHVSQMGIAS